MAEDSEIKFLLDKINVEEKKITLNKLIFGNPVL